MSDDARALKQLIEAERELDQIFAARSLLRRRYLFDLSSFNVGAFALFIGFVEELMNNARSLFSPDSRFLRFLLFSEKLVVPFPAH